MAHYGHKRKRRNKVCGRVSVVAVPAFPSSRLWHAAPQDTAHYACSRHRTPVSVKGTPWSSPVGQCIKRFCYFSRLTTKRSCWIRGLHCRPRDADFGFSSKDDSLVLFLHIFGCSSAPVMFTDIDIKGLIESVATLQRGKSVVTESLCGSKRFCNARRVTRLTNAPNTILKVQECVNGNG